MDWREDRGIRWLEAELPGARATFSTRTGGASGGDFESLNLGVLTEDDRAAVLVNRARLADAIGLDPGRILIGRQVHGGEVAGHSGPQEPSPWTDPGSISLEVDGHFTAETELAALVFVADCLPIALSGPDGIAMLHGGWRGLAGGIVGTGVAAVGATHAAIGPGIGACCYEVGEEVLAAFAPLGPGHADGRMLDLVAVARTLLERVGVLDVEVAGLCTSCNQDLFFSHRGGGPRTGRQAGLVWRSL